MNAKDVFQIGDAVRLTQKAIDTHIEHRGNCDTWGRVVGFSWRDPEFVRVRREGIVTVSTYHMSFWQPFIAGVPHFPADMVGVMNSCSI